MSYLPAGILLLILATRAEGQASRALLPPQKPPVLTDSLQSLLSSRHDTLPAKRLNAPLQICSGGDVLLGTNIGFPTLRLSPDSVLAPLKPLVARADIVLLNIEGAIGSGPVASKCGPNSSHCFAFRMPPRAANALRRLNPQSIIVGNIANNHALDAGEKGRLQTIKRLLDADITVTGQDTVPALVSLASGDTVAFLGFHTSKDTPDARDTALVNRLVRRAATKWPLVIVTMHLGSEGLTRSRVRDHTEYFLTTDRGNPIAFAEAAVTAGAALVIGHGPHAVRGIEWTDKGALIAYSLGNLVTYGPFSMKNNANLGGVLCANINTAGRVQASRFISTVQDKAGLVRLDPLESAGWLVDKFSRRDLARAIRFHEGGQLTPAPSALRF